MRFGLSFGRVARATARFLARLASGSRDTRSSGSPASVEAGARAERAIAERLRALPAPACLFHDVRLEAERRIRFEGAGLLSAQIDYVVLTRAGVFVVEVKGWSERFAGSGNYHDPFDQVRRAGYLCYDLVRDRVRGVKVRSILAAVGSLPTAPRGSFVKVLTPQRLSGYIAHFPGVLSPQEF